MTQRMHEEVIAYHGLIVICGPGHGFVDLHRQGVDGPTYKLSPVYIIQ